MRGKHSRRKDRLKDRLSGEWIEKTAEGKGISKKGRKGGV